MRSPSTCSSSASRAPTIYPLILGVGALTGPPLDRLPLVLEVLVSSGVTVALMTWIVMPRMTRAFARFLYPRRRAAVAAGRAR